MRVNGSNLTLVDLVARARSLHAAFSELGADVVQVVEDANSLAVAFINAGPTYRTVRNPFGTIQPNRAEVQIRTIDVLTITDGKISNIWVNADDPGTLRHLGCRP